MLAGAWWSSEPVCTDGARRAVAGLISGGKHTTQRLARRLLWARNRSSGGRPASLARISGGVQANQYVYHLGTLCPKAGNFLSM